MSHSDRPVRHQVRTMMDEGTSSPFVARLYMGMRLLGDELYVNRFEGRHREETQRQFQQKLGAVLNAALATRDAAAEVLRLVADHCSSIKQGRGIRAHGNQIDILDSIDIPLSQAVDKFTHQAVVATKGRLQEFLRDPLGLEIGFLYQQDCEFERRIARLRSSGERELAQYLCDVRATWSSQLIHLRNQAEHNEWSIELLRYPSIGSTEVTVLLPEINGVRVDQYIRCTANRVLRFIEEMTVYALQNDHPGPIFVVEIPWNLRNPGNPRRFKLGARGLTSAQPWVITYHDEMDFV